MIVEREDNSALYFIVGALLVAVAAFAIYYFASDRQAVENTASDTTRVENVAPASGSTSTNLSVDGNSVSTTTQTQQ